MPDSIEDIGGHALSSCKALVNVKLTPKIERIRPHLFYCSGIETIDIRKNITEIGYFAFWGCNSLKRLVIPEWVKHMSVTPDCTPESLITKNQRPLLTCGAGLKF